ATTHLVHLDRVDPQRALGVDVHAQEAFVVLDALTGHQLVEVDAEAAGDHQIDRDDLTVHQAEHDRQADHDAEQEAPVAQHVVRDDVPVQRGDQPGPQQTQAQVDGRVTDTEHRPT